MNPQLVCLFEAALLAASRPLSITDFKRLSPSGCSEEYIRACMDQLAERWYDRTVELVRVATGWKFRVKSPNVDMIRSVLSEQRSAKYSRATMETIALIAYRQPVTRGDIEYVRGVAVSSQIMQTLIERGWIRMIGRKDVPGRPALYATTRQFLDDFSLTSLNDLPPLQEIDSQRDALIQS